jgi:endonuclease YncB( thermonuclease family)
MRHRIVSSSFVWLAVAVLAIVGGGCEPGEMQPGPMPSPTGDEPDLAPPPVPSGCPAPPVVTPANMPPDRYFPAEQARLIRTVDGDTAHFEIPSGEVTVRFLWVNTEETHGAETTAFGSVAADTVKRWLEAAQSIQVAPGKTSRGQIQRDPYDRMLALIFVDGTLLQSRMTEEGISAYYTEFGCPPSPIHESLLYGEADARANKRGIWAPGHPTDYSRVLRSWIGNDHCRPNPYVEPYCR